jgi:uncharacterized protein YnzC (UPF0291/DUF896 family)
MSLSDKQWDFLQDVAELIAYAKEKRYKLTGGELWRPNEMQELYLEQGKTQVKRSNHQDRLAIDLNLFVHGEIQWSKNSYWEDLGSYWKSLHKDNRWGGDYKTLEDPFHFERL